MENKKVIAILGPTAVGKTALAIQLAQYFDTSILSADSRQCFRELNIGVVKPSAAALRRVPHFFINSHTIHDEVNAALFEQMGLQWAAEVFRKKNILIMVGGTGLYIKAFCEGLDDIPAVPTAMREEIRMAYEKKGIGWLQEQIEKNDPAFYARGEILNPQRLMRALGVKLSSGNSILAYRLQVHRQRPFQVCKIGLQLPKDQLQQHIDDRVDSMMEAGLLDEVQHLLPYRRLNALRTVGYTELFDCLDGRHTLREAVGLIKRNSRQYAKRQLTWFRKDPSIRWIDPREMETIGLDQSLEKIIKT